MYSITKGHATRGNFLCNLQRNGVVLQVARKTSSCDTPCLQLYSLATKNCVASCRESRKVKVAYKIQD